MLASLLIALAFGSAPHRLAPIPIPDVEIDDAFWAPKLEVYRTVTIADAFEKFEKDGAIRNFDRVRDGLSGEHGGPPWYDGLIYEMIRAAADFIAARPDPALERRIDEIIEHIAAAAAKDPDGYVNTYTQLVEPGHRWGRNGGNDNWQHDVYNAGAMVEAAVHDYQATGKTALLRVAARLANHMCDTMGPPPRANVVPGHSIAEEAVIALHRLFRDKPRLKEEMPFPIDEARYLALVEFWIENRGRTEGRVAFGSYGQDHLPVLEQPTIEGHTVRATLLLAGVIAAAMTNERQDYYAAALRLWENLVHRRMHVTGGLGAVAGHEGFGADWFLPRDAYLETCAAVGAAFFHRNMNLAFGEARFADELERALYNGILCGVSLAGDTYFYRNPLEARTGRARWAWHACPCCPPMFLKIMAALPGTIYATDRDGIYVNLFIGSRARIERDGRAIRIRQTTRYPWDGAVTIALDPEDPVDLVLGIRVPSWCREARFAVNGEPVERVDAARGYVRIRRTWRSGDAVEATFAMPIERVEAHPRVEACAGRVALMRGPIVYCIEGADHGGRVLNLSLPHDAPLREEVREDLLGGIVAIRGTALARRRADPNDALYLPADRRLVTEEVPFFAIPYFANANRGPGELAVWIPEAPGLAEAAPCPTIASAARLSASHVNETDTLDAMNDQVEPARSDDGAIPRMTFWDHRGTKEWVQYDFAAPVRVSAVEVYWWDERRIRAHCRVPEGWRILYRAGDAWRPVQNPSPCGVEMDRFNRTTFAPVETTGLRLAIDLQAEWSAGILEWRVE
ncbi:MAG: glycoside hydrolase family 127 protein [Planctomycetes bacterium]|nr:glycoside hydrolase family 127 protein [Planctomycetota bacterium]